MQAKNKQIMENTTVMLEGKPVWKHSPTKLRNFCEKNNIPLTAGLKQNHLVTIVKEHIAKNDNSASTEEKAPAKKEDAVPATAKVKKEKKAPKVKSNDFVLEKPATETEKKIAKMDIMYAVKAWKLHQLGRTTPEIMAITGRWDKPSSTPRIIASYTKNEKLKERADAVKIS